MRVYHYLNDKILLAGLLPALTAAPAVTAPIIGTDGADTITVESLAESLVESIFQDVAEPHRRTLTGVSGQSGNDTISSTGPFTVLLDFEVQRVEAPLLISELQSALDARSAAVGVAGGDDQDQINLSNDGTPVNAGRVEALMSGGVVDVAVDQLVVDPTATELNFNADLRATAIGARGNDGDDQLALSSGALSVHAGTAGHSDSVSLAGVALDDLSMRMDTLATARGLETGAGRAGISNSGALRVEADAETTVFGLELGDVSSNTGDIGVSATARATGLAGGSGGNRPILRRLLEHPC